MECINNDNRISVKPGIPRYFIEDMDEVFFLVDTEGCFTYVSTAFKHMTGYSADEIIGRHLSFIICQDSLSPLFDSCWRPEEGKLHDCHVCFKTSSGDIRSGSISCNSLVIGNQFAGLTACVSLLTDNTRIGRSLEECEKIYRIITENMTDIIWVMGMDLRIIYISPLVEKVRGYSAREIIDIPLREHFTEKSWELVSLKIDDIMSLQKSEGDNFSYAEKFEVEYVNKDNSTIWHEISINLLRDKNGKPAEFICTSRDIKELKKTYFELKKSQDIYTRITDNINEIIWLMDKNLNVSYVNPSGEKVRGFTSDEQKKMKLYEHFTPESGKVVSGIIKNDIAPAIIADQNISVFGPYNLEVTCKFGEPKWHEIVLTVIRGENKNEISFVGVARDITEKRKIEQALKVSEEKFAKAFRYSPNIQILTRLNDGTIIDASNTLHERTDYLKEDIIGKTSAEIDCWVDDKDRDEVWRLLKNTGVVKNKELEMRDKKGKIYNINFSSETMYLDEELYIVSTLFNLSEVRKLEKMVIEISEKEKFRIAHELDSGLVNFLSGISILSNELKCKLEDKFYDESYLANNISNLIDKAIFQTRAISRGLDPLLPGNDCFLTSLESLALSIRSASGVNCIFSKGESIPAISNTVARNLLLIAKEALNGAIALRNPSNIILIVDCEKDKFMLIVRDDGVQQEDIKSDVSYIIIKHIASLIEASVRFEGGENSNSLVCTVNLNDSDERCSRKNNNLKSLPRKKVLIVDEQPLVRLGLIKILEEAGDYEICGEADNYSNMIKAVRKLKPDLLICDFFINDSHNIDLCKSISAIDQSLPVLILSAQDELIYAERLIRSGARGYMLKDNSEKTIMEAVKTVLSGRVYVSKSFSVNIASHMRSLDYSQNDTITNLLSERELEVFTMIGKAFSSKEISSELFLSIKAVEAIRKKLRIKLNIADSKSLVKLAKCWLNSR